MIETQTRWKKHEAKVAPNTRTPNQIQESERRNAFDRHNDSRSTAPSDDRAEMSRSARMTAARQRSGETKNRFGDPQQGGVDPSEKPLRKTVWGESTQVQRNATGMPMDAATRQLRDKMRNDPNVSAKAAGRAPSEVKAQTHKPQPTAEDIQAFVLFLAAAQPEWPMDERRGPNDGSEADQRYREAIVTNATNLKRMWLWLVHKGIAQLDLAGLLLSFSECERGGFLDKGEVRKRGFGNSQLVNIVVEPSQTTAEDKIAHELLDLVRNGRARVERMRPATNEEAEEIRRLRSMPFSDLRKTATGK